MDYSSGEGWCFPMLKDAEIEEFFKELSIDFTAQDMRKPTTARIFIAFGFIVEYTIGATAEEWGDTDWSSHLQMQLRKKNPGHDRPELYFEPMKMRAIYKRMKKVMVAIGMDQFSFYDVLRPEVNRLRIFLSAAINFIRFREDQLQLFNEYEKQSEDLMKQNEELSERYKMLFEKVERSKKKRIEDEIEIKEYVQENASLMNSMRELKKKQTGLLNEIASLKSMKAEAEEKMNNTQFLVITAKQVLEKLKSRIVVNPEKLKQTIEEMNQTMSKEKDAMLGLGKKVRDIQSKVDILSIVEEEIAACNKILDEVLNQRNKCEKTNKDLRDLQEEIENKRQHSRELQKKEQILSRQKQNLEDRIQRQREKHKQRVIETEKKIEALQVEYDRILEERKDSELKAAQQKKIYDEMSAKCTDLFQTWNKEKTEIESEFKALKDRIEGYHQEILLTCRISTG
ncbi:Nuf2 family-domain-containing protein [Gigaspora rosea]|uniref:Nuf2 family-domain-containing protein n=1 Tax=Gigaspora rosea TaxID=44941 RepID=A0A397UMD7_9GLOM|nr:Nuf2 family-domain-containing protein [Gigaspora rosea]